MLVALAMLSTTFAPKTFWTFDPATASPAERTVVQSIQGLVSRKGPYLWQRTGDMSLKLIAEMKSEGWKEKASQDVWEIAAAFKSSIKGAVVCNLNDESINRAATFAGLKDLIVIDASLEDQAKQHGYRIVVDARKEKPNAKKCNDRVAVELASSYVNFLRDYGIKHKAFCFEASTTDERRANLSHLNSPFMVYGWSPKGDEYGWIYLISQLGGSGVAADWCSNLSMMEALGGKVHKKPEPILEPEPKEGERVVAFVLTDGDNIQWLTGGMPTHNSFYGNPLRGKFKMTWEVAPQLASLAPRVLNDIYDRATPQDGFVAACTPQYNNPFLLPDRKAVFSSGRKDLKTSRMRVVGVINVNRGAMTDVNEILDQPEVDAVLYKDYSPYHRRAGAISWYKGKPCISYKFALWENMKGASPEELAQQIAAMPADPLHDANSYALITVHAWSFGNVGGPLTAIKKTIDLLPPGTRVVTAPELAGWVKRYLRPQD